MNAGGFDWDNTWWVQAKARGRSVMLGESTPRFVGVLGGAVSWDAWFAPYFQMINSPEYSIQAFNCTSAATFPALTHHLLSISFAADINWNWAPYPQWSLCPLLRDSPPPCPACPRLL